MNRIIKIIQHNILHWKTNKASLLHTYTAINPDVILMNSHGLRQDESMKIPGYSIHKVNTTNEVNDGSAIAIKHGITYILDDDFISDTLAITLSTNTGPVTLATLYIPPRRQFLPYPDIHKLLYQNNPVYILADLNAKHTTLGDARCNLVGNGINIFMNSGKAIHLGPHFPTLLRHNSATTPDIILSNNRAHLYTHVVPGPLTSSDHLPIQLTIATTPIIINTEPRLAIRRADWNKYRTVIDNQLGPDIDLGQGTLEEIDEQIETWYKAVDRGTKEAIPTTTKRTTTKSILTPQMRQLQRRFETLYITAQRHGLTYRQYTLYKETQQELTYMHRRLRDQEWDERLNELIRHHKDPKEFWTLIKKLNGNDSTPTPYLIKQNGDKVHKEEEKVQLLTETWSNNFRITEEENELFDEENEDRVHQYLRENLNRLTPYDHADPTRLDENHPLTKKITLDEARDACRRSKNNTPGFSGIKKIMITELSEKSIARLITIFNASLSAGYFPDKWKHAIIKMIPKDGKARHDPQNYRPISLLDTPGKLLERIISKRLRSYLEINTLHNPRQYGFRPQRDTTTAIALAYESIAQALARKHQCYVVLRDVSKAFDKVWHNGLKFKLLQIGLPSIIERLLCDFLADRTATIQLGQSKGQIIDLISGVPQGSVISPTLFILYTRDQPPPPMGCQDILYADDVTQIITYQGKSREMMARKVAQEIKRVNQYEKKWKIKTNKNKFTVIPVAQYKTADLIVEDDLIEYKKEGRLLGLKITRRGITKHISEKISKGKAVLSNLMRYRGVTQKIKAYLIKAYLLPILEYPPVPIHTISHTQSLKLQRVLNKGLRFACNVQYPDFRTTKHLHDLNKLQPINIRIHKRATRIWENLETQNDIIYQELREQNHQRSHYWFKSSLQIIDQGPPQPLHTNTN